MDCSTWSKCFKGKVTGLNLKSEENNLKTKDNKQNEIDYFQSEDMVKKA